MKTVLTDHGKIIHWAGAHSLFPVRGDGANDISFAHHGETAGRKPIGWNEFFPAMERSDSVVLADSDEGTLSLIPSDQASAIDAAPAVAH